MQIQTPNNDKLSGQITLLGLVVDKLHKIKTELFDQDYIIAIDELALSGTPKAAEKA